MLIGRDMSHWNTDGDVNAGEFTIVKLTEGRSYIDPKSEEFVKKSTVEQLLGAYHYLRPDTKGNHPFFEAENFVNQMIKLNLLYKAPMFADYEGAAIGNPDYLLTFLQGVEIMTGVKPLVYTSGSVTKELKKVADAGYKLWVAHYNVASPMVYNWKSPTVWQFTSKPFDINIFYGNESDWRALASKK